MSDFALDDIVYIVDGYYDFWHPNETAFKVVEIINCIRKDGISKTYGLKVGDYVLNMSSKFCFRSYDEAKKWCDEKNKELYLERD